MVIDFTEGKKDHELANDVSSVITRIASLKDLLKAWCERRKVDFEGDRLIDSHRDVAIIHDLWNLDKHYKLTRASRSKLSPRISGYSRGARFDGQSWLEETPDGGLRSAGPGQVEHVTDAKIVDENGNHIGNLYEIAQSAVEQWTAAFQRAGAKLPPRG